MLVISICASAMAKVEHEAPRMASSPPTLPTSQTEERSDTLFLFAADGAGAYGMPGTTERGYSFDGPYGEAQEAGWFGVDRNAQEGIWWHVADTDLCAGHATDMSQALPFTYPSDPTNDFALWCGREEACGWVNTPGYGNNWEQWIRIQMPASENIDLAFSFSSFFEGTQWDYLQVIVEKNGVLTYIHSDNTEGASGFHQRNLHAEGYGDTLGDIILSFHSDGAWSDEDGDFLSDVGALWIDNISAFADGNLVHQSDFEDGFEPDWINFESPPSAGNFAQLYPGYELLQED